MKRARSGVSFLIALLLASASCGRTVAREPQATASRDGGSSVATDAPIAPATTASSVGSTSGGTGSGYASVRPKVTIGPLSMSIDHLADSDKPKIRKQVTSALHAAIEQCGIPSASKKTLKPTSFDVWIDLVLAKGPRVRVEGLDDSLARCIATLGESFVTASSETIDDWDPIPASGYIHATATIAPP